MIPNNSTPVPNHIFDHFLPILKPAELTLLLVIIRQTIGWHTTRKHRKYSDWLAGSQLREKTGYSRKALSTAIDGLITHKLIRVHDQYGQVLESAGERQGKTRLYYAFRSDVPATVISQPTYLACRKKLYQQMRMV
jgi:Bacteriophage replication protein O